jgi:hypothetical protein
MGRKMAPEHDTSACSGTCTCRKERRADQPQGLVPTPDFWAGSARSSETHDFGSRPSSSRYNCMCSASLVSLSISFGIRNTPSDTEEIACPIYADSTEIAEIAVDTDGCWHVDSCEITSRLQISERSSAQKMAIKRGQHVFCPPPDNDASRSADGRTTVEPAQQLRADVTKQRQLEPKEFINPQPPLFWASAVRRL